MDMHIRPKCAVAMLILAGVLLSIPSGAALTLKASTTKTQYLVDEPIYVTVTYKNEVDPSRGYTSDMDLPVSASFYPIQHLIYMVSAPGEKPHWYRQVASYVGGTSGANLVLQPNEEYGWATDLTLDGHYKKRTSLLEEPGEYTFLVQYAVSVPEGVDPTPILSNEVKITVVEPKGEDRAALDVLRKGATNNRWGLIWNYDAKSAPAFQEVVSKYPKSAYAPYALHHLAGALWQESLPEETAEELAGLNLRAMEQIRDPHFRLDSAKEAALAFARIGKVDRAEEILEQAMALPGLTMEEKVGVLRQLKLLWAQVVPHMPLHPSGMPEVRVPALSFAKALGFERARQTETGVLVGEDPKPTSSVDPKSGEITVNVRKDSRPTFSADPKSGEITINGKVQPDMRASMKGSVVEVPVSFFGVLLNEHYRTKRFDFLLDGK